MKCVAEVKAISIRDLVGLSAQQNLSSLVLADYAVPQLININTGWSRAISTKDIKTSKFPENWDYTVLVMEKEELLLLISYVEFKKLFE